MTALFHKLRPKHLLYAAFAYLILVIIAAFVGAEIALRSKTRWVKGVFVPVGRRGDQLYLPAGIETLSRGVLGVVPLKPHRGHALLGPATLRHTLVKRPIQTERGRVPHGALVWASSFIYNGTPAQLGIEFEHTTVSTPVGEMPAWHIPSVDGRLGDIAIVIHGHGGQRAQALRMLPALREAGLGSLFVTFRNAHGAPKVGKGYLSLGDIEAEDALAALRWAQEAGYQRAVLYGFSMGGNIALSVLRDKFSPFPIPVTGIVLDCPALDWRDVLRWQGQRYGLPRFLAKHVGRFTEYIVTKRSSQDFDAVDQLVAAPRFKLPILLFHGTRDRTIPVHQSDALAAARPDLVQYHRIEGAKHIRCWNIDPAFYDRTLRRFLAQVLPMQENL